MLKLIVKYINDNYGSKRGLLNHFYYGCLAKLGIYGNFKKIDFTEVTRLVFVCKGNICRSPLGNTTAISQGFCSESYGLECKGNNPADKRAISFGRTLGLQLNSHRSTPIDAYSPKQGDLVVLMEPAHLVKIEKLDLGCVQVTFSGLWLSSPCPYLHDPYNTSTEYFSKNSTFVVNSCLTLLKELGQNTSIISVEKNKNR